MWTLGSVTIAPAAEPVSLEEARVQCRIDPDDTLYDADLSTFVSAARAHLEKVCGIAIVARTQTALADSWADLARLPIAPVRAVNSIGYIDVDGAPQTLSASVYELRARDPLDPFVARTFGQSWPSIQPGSRITLTLDCGHAEVPADLALAVLLLTGHWFRSREAVVTGSIVAALPFGVETLIANDRRWLA